MYEAKMVFTFHSRISMGCRIYTTFILIGHVICLVEFNEIFLKISSSLVPTTRMGIHMQFLWDCIRLDLQRTPLQSRRSDLMLKLSHPNNERKCKTFDSS